MQKVKISWDENWPTFIPADSQGLGGVEVEATGVQEF